MDEYYNHLFKYYEFNNTLTENNLFIWIKYILNNSTDDKLLNQYYNYIRKNLILSLKNINSSELYSITNELNLYRKIDKYDIDDIEDNYSYFLFEDKKCKKCKDNYPIIFMNEKKNML